MMVFPVSMPQGIVSYSTGKNDHAYFKPGIVNDIDAKKRKAA
jgi:hypothetical protein